MLKTISTAELTAFLLREHPGWDPDAAANEAARYISSMDERLDGLLRAHLDTGATPNLRQDDISLFMIRNLRPGRTYFTALTMMDAYLKDPVRGRDMIFRR